DSEERDIIRYSWSNGQLAQQWKFASDWKPEPTGGFQPSFQSSLCGDALYVPGAGGTIFKLDRMSGAVLQRYQPFGTVIDPDTYVAGPLTTDSDCNVYYTALKLDHDQRFNADMTGWLVKIFADGTVKTADFTTLTNNVAPAPSAMCVGTFSEATT